LTLKPAIDFCKRKASKDGLNHWCRKCVTANNKLNYHKDIERSRLKARQWDAANRPKRFVSEIKFKFGITEEIYNSMLEKQNFCCAICFKPQSELKRRLCVDHCHRTNTVRGLLCSKCNQAIGLLDDKVSNLLTAIDYLKKSTP